MAATVYYHQPGLLFRSTPATFHNKPEKSCYVSVSGAIGENKQENRVRVGQCKFGQGCHLGSLKQQGPRTGPKCYIIVQHFRSIHDRLHFNLNEQRRIDERLHFHHRSDRPHIREELPVRFSDRLPLRNVGHKHARPHDIVH